MSRLRPQLNVLESKLDVQGAFKGMSIKLAQLFAKLVACCDYNRVSSG
jgi:hypothetical protein